LKNQTEFYHPIPAFGCGEQDCDGEVVTQIVSDDVGNYSNATSNMILTQLYT